MGVAEAGAPAAAAGGGATPGEKAGGGACMRSGGAAGGGGGRKRVGGLREEGRLGGLGGGGGGGGGGGVGWGGRFGWGGGGGQGVRRDGWDVRRARWTPRTAGRSRLHHRRWQRCWTRRGYLQRCWGPHHPELDPRFELGLAWVAREPGPRRNPRPQWRGRPRAHLPGRWFARPHAPHGPG